jgi:hypothetical protein
MIGHQMNGISITDQQLRRALVGVLSELIDTLQKGSAVSDAQPSSDCKMFQDLEPSKRLTTEWPRLSADLTLPPDPFHDDAFRRRFVPAESAYLYAAGCSGLCQLAKTLQLPLFKFGLTGNEDLLVRQQQLRIDRYAGSFMDGDQYLLTDGFADWELRQIEVSKLKSGALITVMPRCLHIRLPKCLPFHQFEKLIQHALQPIALHRWIETPEGREHLSGLSISPALGTRYTGYEFGSSTRYSRASEIYISRPRGDFDRVAALSIDIIRQHVLAEPIVRS